MKLSLDWIGDYVSLPADRSATEIAHDLTMTTVEVEGVENGVFEIDNKSMTNRPDLWGHYGVARELAAIYRVPLLPAVPEDVPWPPASGDQASGSPLLGTFDEQGVRRFTATMITNVDSTPTPAWMAARLTAVGQRALGLLYADLTNYVMLTTGQPSHAFDADLLDLPLSVRAGRDGETLVTLDGTKLTLTASDLVVADRTKAVALAGVVGGLATGVSASTRRVLVEIANFDPLRVRRTSARHAVRTEASARFEKDLSTSRVDEARGLLLALLKRIAPAAAPAAFEDRPLRLTTTAEIETTADFLRRRIGKQLPVTELREPLERLGFQVRATGEHLSVTVPEWRNTGDISGPHDLVEEIARLYGYERFEFQPPRISLETTARQYGRDTVRRIKEYLAFACGMREVVNYPWTEDRFVAGAGLATGPLRLAAPPAPDQGSLRTSLVPGLLQSIETNVRWLATFSVFEAGTVFGVGPESPKDDPRESLPPMGRRVAGAFVGGDAEELFREAKGVLEGLGARVHVSPVTIEPGTAVAWADAGAAAVLAVNGAAAGHLALLNRRAREAAGLKHGHGVVFELDLDTLVSQPSRTNTYVAVPALPPFDVDVSLVFADNVTWSEIQRTAAAVDPLIAAVTFVDQYRGKPIAAGHRSITLRAHLQPVEHTLTSDQAIEIANRVRRALHQLGGRERA